MKCSLVDQVSLRRDYFDTVPYRDDRRTRRITITFERGVAKANGEAAGSLEMEMGMETEKEILSCFSSGGCCRHCD